MNNAERRMVLCTFACNLTIYMIVISWLSSSFEGYECGIPVVYWLQVYFSVGALGTFFGPL